MQEFITPSRIANSILQKTKFEGTYIIVEGKNDYTFYRKFTKNDDCNVEIAFGNLKAIQVIHELLNRGYQSAIAIIDSDFAGLDGKFPGAGTNNLFFTDEHDLEMMVMRSDAFDIVLDHYAIKSKIETFRKENDNKTLREIFFELATPLAYLKLANKRYNLGLLFKPEDQDGNVLPIHDFIKPADLKLPTLERMIEVVFNYSRKVNQKSINTDAKECKEKMASLMNDKIDLYQLCNGHDVANIICVALRRKISNQNSKVLTPETYEEALIFAYDSIDFKKTDLYKRLKKWEEENKKTFLRF